MGCATSLPHDDYVIGQPTAAPRQPPAWLAVTRRAGGSKSSKSNNSNSNSNSNSNRNRVRTSSSASAASDGSAGGSSSNSSSNSGAADNVLARLKKAKSQRLGGSRRRIGGAGGAGAGAGAGGRRGRRGSAGSASSSASARSRAGAGLAAAAGGGRRVVPASNNFVSAVNDSCNPGEFELLSLLGRGTLGRVFLAKHSASGKYYAIKRISKTDVCRRKNMKGVLSEIDTLRAARHPFIIALHAAIQDNQFIYLVEDYACGGELYCRMTKSRFPEAAAKFYFAEIAWALRYLHNQAFIAFRDLKPENVMLDHAGHVQLVDFGFAVQLNHADEALPKSCGTSMYMAPELLKRKGRHGLAVDWWAAGCLLFEMLTGATPFEGDGDASKWEIYTKVSSNAKIKFPRYVSENARDLIRNLVAFDPEARYKWDKVQKHPWLAGVDWDAIASRTMQPPFVPTIHKEGDRGNFPARTKKKDPPEMDLGPQQLAYCDINQRRT